MSHAKANRRQCRRRDRPDRALRAATRIAHWIVAISFVLLALSGLAMFYPPLFWLSNLFGGGDTMRAVHPWIGLVMVVAFLALAGKVRRYMRMEDRIGSGCANSAT